MRRMATDQVDGNPKERLSIVTVQVLNMTRPATLGQELKGHEGHRSRALVVAAPVGLIISQPAEVVVIENTFVGANAESEEDAPVTGPSTSAQCLLVSGLAPLEPGGDTRAPTMNGSILASAHISARSTSKCTSAPMFRIPTFIREMNGCATLF
ncbi:hypothetical protein PUNSTDRAFT_131917 [Punctularia strigosozonata HHB-11173 SS5]|uniref:uncharacterized protein n=1 Tax=Punctularia strigosozonata (strain HHB-11173) TaxID=741275 RepID=UPI000441856B|nr:uncharacterized protein PUNSTDRAFT_131917 [Punctularia strigosozonata HHB-11173 SS5]EIN11762.1 hypothetical protein PUNSTDRAFT_131917 [Punctularia strigosozonata HHB-11173 SS5]